MTRERAASAVLLVRHSRLIGRVAIAATILLAVLAVGADTPRCRTLRRHARHHRLGRTVRCASPTHGLGFAGPVRCLPRTPRHGKRWSRRARVVAFAHRPARPSDARERLGARAGGRRPLHHRLRRLSWLASRRPRARRHADAGRRTRDERTDWAAERRTGGGARRILALPCARAAVKAAAPACDALARGASVKPEEPASARSRTTVGRGARDALRTPV